MVSRIAPIVEGDGELEAVPVLLRRLVGEMSPLQHVAIAPPIRVKRDRFLKFEEDFRKKIWLGAQKAGADGALIVLLDADDDCAAQCGPAVLDRMRRTLPPAAAVKLACVFAVREFEGWFLAAATSLRGIRGLPPDLEGPEDPESIRGAKEWLAARMGRYRETLDQPALAATFDMHEARRRSRSFDKFHRDCARLLTDEIA
ncbi:MAG: DUF4276 family protein [Gammaproteobacteria bacterium]|nr:DUF4276 family protein [Gammaproteobacteria bacterium]